MPEEDNLNDSSDTTFLSHFPRRIRKLQKRNYSRSRLSQEEDDDDTFLPAPNVRTKSGTLCRQPRHTLMSCDKLAGFRRPPLARHDGNIRIELSNSLMQPNVYKSTTLLDVNEDDIIVKMPLGIKALILNKKCEYVNSKVQSLKVLLRCTFLFEEGRSNMMFHKKLCIPQLITRWITKSKSNLIVNDIPLENDI